MKIQSGEAIEFIEFPKITQKMLNYYAEASGDLNPIHLDEKVAKQVGLPGVIAHGMFIAGWMADRALRVIRESPALEGYELVRFQTRFKAMTFLGDQPCIGGAIKSLTTEQLILDLQTRNQKGEVTTFAVVEFQRKERGSLKSFTLEKLV